MWSRSRLPTRSPLTKPQQHDRDDEALDEVLIAARAAESKKALDLRILDLSGITSFADYFVICSGSNQRQIQAIADEVLLRMKEQGRVALGVEGYDRAEWVLIDYGALIVHVFSDAARKFYDLERLWRAAKYIELPEST